MASRRFSQKPPTHLCTERSPEDGADPRFDSRDSQSKVINRKALQLCRQVERTLSVVLEGEILRDLTVQSVVPAPDSSRLLVTLDFHGPTTIETAAVLAALREQYARLRKEVAAAICRRKTPELAFHIVRP